MDNERLLQGTLWIGLKQIPFSVFQVWELYRRAVALDLPRAFVIGGRARPMPVIDQYDVFSTLVREHFDTEAVPFVLRRTDVFFKLFKGWRAVVAPARCLVFAKSVLAGVSGSALAPSLG